MPASLRASRPGPRRSPPAPAGSSGSPAGRRAPHSVTCTRSVLNAALVSLSERQREVGTFRVLGYSPGQISRIFSGESLLLNATGIVLGLFAGIGLIQLISKAYSTELYRFPVVIYPSRLVITAVLMVLIVGLAQSIVFRMIKSLDWLEVLKIKE